MAEFCHHRHTFRKAGMQMGDAFSGNSDTSVAGDVSPEDTYFIISCSSTRILTVSTASFTAVLACVNRLMQRWRSGRGRGSRSVELSLCGRVFPFLWANNVTCYTNGRHTHSFRRKNALHMNTPLARYPFTTQCRIIAAAGIFIKQGAQDVIGSLCRRSGSGRNRGHCSHPSSRMPADGSSTLGQLASRVLLLRWLPKVRCCLHTRNIPCLPASLLMPSSLDNMDIAGRVDSLPDAINHRQRHSSSSVSF